jgi:hypothetical protein
MHISKCQVFLKAVQLSDLVEPDSTLEKLQQIMADRKAGKNLQWKKHQQQTSPYQEQKRIISET